MQRVANVNVFRPIPFVIGAIYPNLTAVEARPEHGDGRPPAAALLRLRARRAAAAAQVARLQRR